MLTYPYAGLSGGRLSPPDEPDPIPACQSCGTTIRALDRDDRCAYCAAECPGQVLCQILDAEVLAYAVHELRNALLPVDLVPGNTSAPVLDAIRRALAVADRIARHLDE